MLVVEMCQAMAGTRGPYTLRTRAARMASTRQAITEAAVALHQEVGPLATSVAAIAARAGLSRPTIYAHFPDDRSLLVACTAHYLGLHQPPDPSDWRAIPDPIVRLRHGLAEIYRFWTEVEPMAAPVMRDHAADPAREIGTGFIAWSDACCDVLLDAWAIPSGRRRRVAGVVGHATRFETWRSLVRDSHLTRTEAIDTMAAAIVSTL